MYLRTLSISNMKLIRELQLDFLRDGEPRMWTVLVGENGLGKTTILQAIGMLASGVDRANQMAKVPALADPRSPEQEVVFSAEFSLPPGNQAAQRAPQTTGLRGPPGWLGAR